MLRGQQPSVEATRSAYDEWHDAHSAGERSDPPWHRLVKKHVGSLAPGESMLEIGCGGGDLAAYFGSQRTASVVAADFSRTAVRLTERRIRAHGLSNVTVETQDIQRLGYADESFDLVVSCETVEHVQRPAVAVAELARVLRPGGRMLLTTPNYLSLTGLMRIYRTVTGRPWTEGDQPLNRVTLFPRTLWWVRRAGLQVISLDFDGYYLPIPRRVEPFEIPMPRRLKSVIGWTGVHSLVAARKPRSPDR